MLSSLRPSRLAFPSLIVYSSSHFISYLKYNHYCSSRHYSHLVMSSFKSSNKAFVHSLPNESTLTINISINGRACELNRSKEEPLMKTFQRLLKNIAPSTKASKKNQKQAEIDCTEPVMPILFNDFEKTR
mmetsp:Transcript_2976/g.4796  ORF Transcript_2976/g.4796 Transcript_2976/m.4796 type:complete len:130 (-) Transcript_2976:309-698(-)